MPENSYSTQELQLLCNMLINQTPEKHTYSHIFEGMATSLFDNNYNLSYAFTANINDDNNDIPHFKGDWNGYWWDTDTINFMKYTPIEDVPLFINHPILSIFSQWRLLIGH